MIGGEIGGEERRDSADGGGGETAPSEAKKP